MRYYYGYSSSDLQWNLSEIRAISWGDGVNFVGWDYFFVIFFGFRLFLFCTLRVIV